MRERLGLGNFDPFAPANEKYFPTEKIYYDYYYEQLTGQASIYLLTLSTTIV